MIDWLRTTKSANFQAKAKRLPKKAIVELFRTIRQNSEAPSNDIFRHVKESLGHASWSALAFLYERDPSFLDTPDDDVKESICAFLLLVEYRDHVALFKSNLEVPSEFKTEYFQRIGANKVEAAIARAGVVFEKIGLRNMSASKYALRNKTLEAIDLQSVVGPAGASRYVPRTYRVREGGEHYSASPDSGKISMRSERAGYEELVQWAVVVIDLLITQNAPTSAFIRAFARPIDLSSLPPTTTPTHFAVDVARLTEELFETPEAQAMQLLRGLGDSAVVLSKDETDAILAVLDQSLTVRKVRSELRLTRPADNARVGVLNIGKARISLRKLTLPEIENVYVKSANQPANDEDSGVPLKRYIDQNNFFTVLFSDPTIVYLDGELYKDDSLTDGTVFLSYVKTDSHLSVATSEKGAFTAAHTTFDATSVFGVITDRIAANDEVLVCDDLGDEWADFVGIDASHQPKTISFYHAKYDALSLGASPLQILVSQAIKNLSRINLAEDDVLAKSGKWANVYANDHVVTAIPRIVRGNQVLLQNKISDALSSPDTIRRVFIVTSSISRAQLEQRFAAFRAGEAPEPHFVQLYQLLRSYFSACIEVGAFAYIVCQE
jgi:hypothetical protein